MYTVDKKYLLTTGQMATFVAQGFLRFDELIPQDINTAAMAEFDAGMPSHAAGTPLSECYPAPCTSGRRNMRPIADGAG